MLTLCGVPVILYTFLLADTPLCNIATVNLGATTVNLGATTANVAGAVVDIPAGTLVSQSFFSSVRLLRYCTFILVCLDLASLSAC